MEQIYVRLLNEGTEVYRPVEVESIDGKSFRICGTEPPDEEWEFPPGSLVRVVNTKASSGDDILVVSK